jgi:hypothetical protein
MQDATNVQIAVLFIYSEDRLIVHFTQQLGVSKYANCLN